LKHLTGAANKRQHLLHPKMRVMLCKKLICLSFVIWLGTVAGQITSKLMAESEKTQTIENHCFTESDSKD
jgi:hypothetical protein